MGQPGEGLTGEGSEAARGESREVEARGRVGSTENRQEGREWAWGCTGPVLSGTPGAGTTKSDTAESDVQTLSRSKATFCFP